ncbi:MAG: carbohydrate kinase family protein [Desulfocucumaceae bacterium]
MDLNVAVIGTIFIDCKGFAKQKYNPLGRNLGIVKFVHGGVGRNVAENLANLGLPVFFVSTVDNSALGTEVVHRLNRAGVNLEFLSYADQKGMGMWLAVLDQKGDLAGSISQMPDLGLLESLVAEKGRIVVEKASHIVLELDLNESISRRIVEISRRYNKPIYGIPGNLDVIMKNQDLLGCMDCFICNDIEGGRLLGKDLTGLEAEELQEVLTRYVKGGGPPSMVITLGARGSVYYDSRTREKGFQPAFQTEVTDSSGAGDAFFSGTVMGLIRNRPLGEAVIYGTRVAYWTIQVEENTSQSIPARIREERLFMNVMSLPENSLKTAAGR